MKHTTLSRFASLAASAALALSLAACGSTSRSTYSAAPSNDTAAFSSQDAGDYEYYSAESAEAGEGSSFSSDDLTSSMLDPSTVESSRKIVYNASVRMETTDYDTTRAALQEAVTAANGYLESTDQGGSKDSGSRYTYYTARIPAENYRSFLTAAGEAGNVTSLNESAHDQNGLIKSVSCGTTKITAQVGDKTAELILTVVLPFKDVNEQDWYYNSVKYCYEKGIIKGATETEFRPNAKLSVLSIIHRTFAEILHVTFLSH